MFYINGVQIKTPHGFDISRYNLTKSGRVGSGDMTMDLIAKKKKFGFTYDALDGPELKAILALIFDSPACFFELTYPDETGDAQTKTVYVGEIPSKHVRGRGKYTIWKDVTFSLIER